MRRERREGEISSACIYMRNICAISRKKPESAVHGASLHAKTHRGKAY